MLNLISSNTNRGLNTTNYNKKTIKVQFSISGLKNYAYQHEPVMSFVNRQPLEEIITTQPLINVFDTNPTHIYYLTYIYYKTTSFSNEPIINGYGYLTCNFFEESSIRTVFSVTEFTTRILSGNLFGVGNGQEPDGKLNYSENVYFYNNNNGSTVNAILSIDGDIVTIEG